MFQFLFTIFLILRTGTTTAESVNAASLGMPTTPVQSLQLLLPLHQQLTDQPQPFRQPGKVQTYVLSYDIVNSKTPFAFLCHFESHDSFQKHVANIGKAGS